MTGSTNLAQPSLSREKQMAGSKIANNFWRMAGLSYLQYLNVSSHVLRSSLKEPARSRALGRQVVFYNKTVKDVKTPIKSLLP